MPKPRVTLIGAPLDLGAGRRGVDMGPSALRLTHLGPRLQELGLHVVDEGNVEVAVAEATDFGDPRARYVREVAATCGQIFEVSRVWATVERRWSLSRSCWAATTRSRWDRWRPRRGVRERGSASGSSGSTPTPT